MMHHTAPTPARRIGFTLTELLVVIAIIVVLTALVAAAYFSMIGNQQRRNTEGSLYTVLKTFNQHWSQIVSDAKKETVPDQVKAMVGQDLERARVVWTKIRLMEAFPVSYAEVNNNAALNDPTFLFLYGPHPLLGPEGAIPKGRRKNFVGYQKALNYLKAAKIPSDPEPSESAACLLMALSVKRAGTSLETDTIAGAIADTDGDGVKELTDNWGKPLSFYRFAWSKPGSAPPFVQKLKPAQSGPRAAKCDPLDPDGALITWPAGSNRTYFESLFHPILFSPNEATYAIPAIVSGGDDKATFLFPPVLCPSKGLTLDPSSASTPNDLLLGEKNNIYSFNIKAN